MAGSDKTEKATPKRREAFGLLVSRYQDVVCAVSYSSTGNWALSEDVAQDTFIAAWSQLGQLREVGRLRSWLCGIARHVCVHMLETRRKSRELLELVPIEGEARDAFEMRRHARVLREALAKLKPTEREALVLRFVADLSHREIAAACNLDEPTARKRISRALAKLRSVMPDQENV